jgi:hypothetical protein
MAFALHTIRQCGNHPHDNGRVLGSRAQASLLASAMQQGSHQVRITDKRAPVPLGPWNLCAVVALIALFLVWWMLRFYIF